MSTDQTITEYSDLTKLCWRFPRSVIKQAPKGNASYVPHSVVEQRLLITVGPPDTTVMHVIRGDVPSRKQGPDKQGNPRPDKPPLSDVVVGVVLRMSVIVDAVLRTVEEAGDCGDPHNWEHDGMRLKDAMSDAYKRCAMRLGVGLHLWCKDGYDLDQRMKEADDAGARVEAGQEVAGADDEHDDETDAQLPSASSDVPPPTPEPARQAPVESGGSGDHLVCHLCQLPYGDHSLRKQDGRWVHRKCPTPKGPSHQKESDAERVEY